jgi:DNA-binding HxlR family transcriptional regulator
LIVRAQEVRNGVTYVFYAYSEYGLGLVPVLDALGDWGVKHAALRN